MAVRFHGFGTVSVGIKRYPPDKEGSEFFVVIRTIDYDQKVIESEILHIDWMRLGKELEMDRLLMEEE